MSQYFNNIGTRTNVHLKKSFSIKLRWKKEYSLVLIKGTFEGRRNITSSAEVKVTERFEVWKQSDKKQIYRRDILEEIYHSYKNKVQGQRFFSSNISATSFSNRLNRIWIEMDRKAERFKFDKHGRHAIWMNYIRISNCWKTWHELLLCMIFWRIANVNFLVTLCYDVNQ